jgi:NADPH:quinone reductase
MSDIPDTMNAVALDRFGGADRLSLRQVPVPSLDPDEILIHVHTAGVGVWDPSEREGKMKGMMGREPSFPYILGSDGAGTVVATGARVDRFEEGDRVYASAFLNPKGGFYAEYVAVKADQAMPIPAGLTLEEAGAMPTDAVTALRGLRDELALEEGEALMVFGASGGVGHLAVQFAHTMGASVLAVASGSDGVTLVEELEADAAVDGHADGDMQEAIERMAPNGLDAALLTASGEGVETALESLHGGGRVAWPNGVEPEPDVPRQLKHSSYDGAVDREILEETNRLIESGPFMVHVDRIFSMDEVAEAHEVVRRHHRGKLAIRISE